MKKILPLLFLSTLTLAQTSPVTIYHENFDGSPPFQVTNGFSTASGFNAATEFWDTSSFLAVSGNYSYHVGGTERGNDIWFETDSFSTLGSPYVLLSFEHIAKIFVANEAHVEYSTNGGLNWSPIPEQAYLGSNITRSPLYVANEYFNSVSYVVPGLNLNYWLSGSNTPANSSMWVKEEFQLRGLLYDTVTNTGYNNCKLRFKADFDFASTFPSTFYDGWYIDNIDISGSICDFRTIFMDFNVGPSVNAPYKPEGTVVANSTGNYTVALTAQHTSSIDRIELIWTRSGVTDTLNMALINASTGEYSIDIPNLQVGDTVDWRLEAYPVGCSIISRLPSNGHFNFHIVPTPPSKCGIVYNTQSPYLIRTFPWTEDFEGPGWTPGSGYPSSLNLHRGSFPTSPNGNWVVSPSSNFNFATSYAWSVADSAVPGTNNLSGPSSNHTPNGTNFLYTAGNFNTTSTRFVSPCIELDGDNFYELEFWYHLFGNDIGLLRVDIDTGANSAAWWLDYWSIAGEQQSSSSDPWQSVKLSLIPFRGKTIRVRFLSRKYTTGPEAFMAVDDISIKVFTPSAEDIQMNAILSPIANNCTFSNSELLKVSFQNNGFDTLQSVPLAYQLDGGAIVRDTAIVVGLEPGDTASLNFANTLNLLSFGNHNLKVWAELSGDTIYSNDTLKLLIRHYPTINSFPFVEDFESSTAAPNLFQDGTLNSPYFILNNEDNSAVNGSHWLVYDQTVRKISHGPLGGSQRQGNYLLFANNSSTTATKAELVSHCIDFSSLTEPQLSFNYHCLDPQVQLIVKARERGDITWTILDSLSVVQTDKSQDYRHAQVDLSSFAGKTIEIALETNYGNSVDYHIAIDDLAIFNRTPGDLALISVGNPGYQHGQKSQNSAVSFNIANTGPAVSSQSITLNMTLTELCSSPNPRVITGSVSTNIALSYAQENSFTQIMSFDTSLTKGYYSMKAWIDVPGNIERYNDTISRIVQITSSVAIPYLNDFEGCEPDFYVEGDVRDWQRGMPGKLGNAAHSGQNAWLSHLSESTINSQEFLLVPPLKGFDTIYGAYLSFWQNYDFGNGFGVVEYRNQGQWQSLTDPNIQGVNWNTSYNVNAGGEAFQGSTGGWIKSVYPLTQFNLRSTPLRIRFRVEGSHSPGWAIDDFEVFLGSQNSASPVELLFASAGPPKIGSQNIKVRIRNIGERPLNEVRITALLNGNQFSSLIYQIPGFPPLNKGGDVVALLPDPLVLTNVHNVLQIITSFPNAKADDVPIDDTLTVQFSAISPISNLPYCTDFELNTDFVPFHTPTGSLDSNWIYGTPTKNIINSANSGTKCWFTSNNLYSPLQDQYLYTPEFDVVVNQCYSISFEHQFQTEVNLDGGTVDYTVDGGNNWQSLGSINDSLWFNTPHIQALDAFKPGWSGSSGTWLRARKITQFYNNGRVQFRFRFASNSTVQDEGWAVDDFCFEPYSGMCSLVSIDEQVESSDENLQLYPNPASQSVSLLYQGSNNGKAELQIVNNVGQVVLNEIVVIDPNRAHELDISKLSKGLYSLRIVFENLEGDSRIFEKL